MVKNTLADDAGGLNILKSKQKVLDIRFYSYK